MQDENWAVVASIFHCLDKPGFHILKNIPVGEFCYYRQISSRPIFLCPMWPFYFLNDILMVNIFSLFLNFIS